MRRNYHRLSPEAVIYLQIILPPLMVLVLLVIIIQSLVLPTLRDSILKEKHRMLKNMTGMVTSLLETYHSNVAEGKMDLEEAQHRAASRVRAMRYGPEMKDYFWISTTADRLIVHPYRPDLEKTDVSGYQDPSGKRVFREFSRAMESSPEAFVEYEWQYKDVASRIIPKISHIRLFEPWAWIVGTGTYTEEIAAAVDRMERRLAMAFFVVFGLVTLIVAYIIRDRLASYQRERHAQQLQLQSENRLRTVLEFSTTCCYWMSPSNELLYVSPAWSTITGYTTKEFHETPSLLQTLVHPDDRNLWREHWHTSLKGDREEVLLRILTRQGNTRIIEHSSLPVRDENGEYMGVRGGFRDIAEPNRYRQFFLKEQSRAEFILNSLVQPILLLDADHHVVSVNQAFLKLFPGKSMEDISGKPFYEICEKIWGLPEVHRLLKEIPATRKQAAESEVSLEIPAAGARSFLINASAVEEPQSAERLILLVFEDVTRLKSTENVLKQQSTELSEDNRNLEMIRDELEEKRKELIKKQEALERTNKELIQKNTELNEFSYVASHDLQEPLRKLIAFSELLHQDMPEGLPENARRDLDFILNGARRMQALVQDLLRFSRTSRTQLQLKQIPLDHCVDEALQSLSKRLKESKTRVIRQPLPQVRCDPSLMTQVYLNLIGNALKFNKRAEPQIEITFAVENSENIYGVRDNGIGIEEEYFQQVFLPFRRLHGQSKYEGSGIGLALCARIVERHGGRIWVESTINTGSHFKFTLGEKNGKQAG